MTDIGNTTPAENEDVAFATSVQWAGPAGVAKLSWTVDNGLAGELVVSDDTLSAKLVTAPGNFSAVVTVSAANGVSDQATVSRVAGEIAAIGLSASVVPKA